MPCTRGSRWPLTYHWRFGPERHILDVLVHLPHGQGDMLGSDVDLGLGVEALAVYDSADYQNGLAAVLPVQVRLDGFDEGGFAVLAGGSRVSGLLDETRGTHWGLTCRN